jgi:serine/threonine protein kinase
MIFYSFSALRYSFLSTEGSDAVTSDRFWEEFDILKGLEPHIHVVGLVGIIKEPVHALVVEYCDGGDLKSYLLKVLEFLFSTLVINCF